MTFGRLTTKFRILRRTLNYKNDKNAKIIRVCTKLHNYCIRMQQHDNDPRGWVPAFMGNEIIPSKYGIDAICGSNNRSSEFGFLDTRPEDDPVTVPPRIPQDLSNLAPDSSLRESIAADIRARGIGRPQRNRLRND